MNGELPAPPASRARCARALARRTPDFVPFADEDVERSVADRLERIAKAHADSVAVTTPSTVLTYGELNARANRLARAILAQAGDGAEPVALLLGPGADAIVAMLGTLKAGKFYVPLDPRHPEARNRFIFDETETTLVVTNEAGRDLVRSIVPARARSLEMEYIDGALASDDLGRRIAADDLAYVIYTSGTTGEPKGVMQTHRNVLHKVQEYTNGVRICVHDRLVLLYSPSTSGAVRDIYGALLNGAALCPFDVRSDGLGPLARWLVEQRITVYNSVATLFRHFAETLADDRTLPDVRLVHVGSETIYKSDVDLYRRHFCADCIFVANLGSTEASPIRQFFVDCGTPIASATVPAGYPLADAEVRLLDEEGKTVPQGEPGEIAVRSRYLSPGYWRRPDLTRAAYLPDPDGGDRRIYRTGDLGRLEADGCLLHLGRKDFQVKIRGFRVETAEIELALRSLPGIRDAAVIASADRRGDARLVAFVVAAEKPVPRPRELRRWLRKRLPAHMVPTAYVALEALPTTASGKLDRRALPVPDVAAAAGARHVISPRDRLEAELAGIWEHLLQVGPVGVTDDFFDDLGGDSLLAVRLFAEIAAHTGRELPLASLFEAPTIEKQARLLRDGTAPRVWSSLVAIRARGTKPPLFCAHAHEGNVLFYRALAHRLGPDQPFYALQAQGVEGRRPPHRRVEDMAADYLREIRALQPQGPYFLGGYCFGGLVAFELARQLAEEGQPVAFLALFDTYAPGYRDGAEATLADRVRRLAQKIDLHASNFWLMPRGRKILYARQRAAKMRRRLLRALGFPSPGAPPALLDAMAEASARYAPESYGGSLVLFRASVQPAGLPADPALGWRPLVRGGIEIQSIPGHYGTIVLEPRVDGLIRPLVACLTAARRATSVTADTASAVRC